jgi:hypothetical protein
MVGNGDDYVRSCSIEHLADEQADDVRGLVFERATL